MSNKMIELGDIRRASVDSLAELLREAGCTVELPEKKTYPKKRFDGDCVDGEPCYLVVEADAQGVSLTPVSSGPAFTTWSHDASCLVRALTDALAYCEEAAAAERS